MFQNPDPPGSGDMTARALHIRHLVWAAALTFALGVAFAAFTLAGFVEGLGPAGWPATLTNALVALAVGSASQVGLVLAPVVRVRGVVPRGAITVLMAPAFALGVLAYRDLFSRPGGLGLTASFHPLLLVFLSIVPVYVAVVVWMWVPRSRPADAAA